MSARKHKKTAGQQQAIDLRRLADLNKVRSPGEWHVSENGHIANDSGYVGDWDFSYEDEAFLLYLINNADLLISAAKAQI